MLAQRGQQMRQVPGAVAGAGKNLPFNAMTRRPSSMLVCSHIHPADQAIQTTRVQALQTAADRGLTPHHTA